MGLGDSHKHQELGSIAITIWSPSTSCKVLFKVLFHSEFDSPGSLLQVFENPEPS